jgi:outer membrane lipoprotein-sorting protein
MYQNSIFTFIFLFSSAIFCYTNEEALANIQKRSSEKYCPFTVTLTSKVVIGSNKQEDSGAIYYSPRGFSRVEMYKAKTCYSSCGDTCWFKMPNGDVTRSIKKDDVLGFSKNQATMPDLGALIKKYSGKIVETLGDSALTFEVKVPVEKESIQNMRLTFDTRQWLLRKVSIFGGQMGETVASYAYTQFKGRPMLKEVQMVMGSMGFMNLSYCDYKEIKEKKERFYRIY